jgi:hypothetical protein
VQRSMAKKVFASVPDAVAGDLEVWAEQQGRSLSNLISFLLENAIRDAKARGEFEPQKPSVTTK